jgi:hypothetical protein
VPRKPLTPVNTDGAPADRAANGRFLPGNQAARGNPFFRKVAALRRALVSCVTEAQMKRLGKALFKLAEGGDAAAAKVLLLYTLGKPAEVVDPDSEDWHEQDVVRKRRFADECRERHEALRKLREELAAASAELVRTAREAGAGGQRDEPPGGPEPAEEGDEGGAEGQGPGGAPDA